MDRRVLSVGQCGPDHHSITSFLSTHFSVRVDRADSLDETLEQLRAAEYHLVLVNRKLDADYSDGMLVLRAVRTDPDLQHIPVMLVSNYPDAQERAVAAGALYGFGKAELHLEDTLARLVPVLQA